MRRKLAAAALVAGAAASLLPISQASAVCMTVLYETTGYCSPCQPLAGPYNTVDRATGDRLGPLNCVD